MFRKTTIIKGLIILLVIGVLATLSWAGLKVGEKKEEIKTQPIEEKSQKETLGDEYVMKKILFVPWGDGEGEIGLRVIETLVQGIEPEISRYGATKLKVDKDGNIYIWDDVVWLDPDLNYKIIKKPKSNKILKYTYVKEKKNGEEIEKYEYVESIPLNLKFIPRKGVTIIGKPFKVEEFESKYRFERYIINKETDRRGLKVIDVNTGKEIGKIDYIGLDDGLTYYTTPLGSDTKGNVYVLIDTTDIRSAPFILEVCKYNIENKLLARIKLSMDDFDWTDRFYGQRNRVTVDKDGNVYQLLAKKDGVHILKWKIR